jgi:hypothetical protein
MEYYVYNCGSLHRTNTYHNEDTCAVFRSNRTVFLNYPSPIYVIESRMSYGPKIACKSIYRNSIRHDIGV